MDPLQPELFVAHYHEVGLKGRNRGFFEKRLADNIRVALDGAKVRLISGRILVEVADTTTTDQAAAALSMVFGLSSFSPAWRVEPTIEAMTDAALALANAATFSSFQVRARRGNSSFPESSQRINEIIGAAVKEASGARVDLTDAEWTCRIELVERSGFIYSQKLPGPGGLPVGSSGKVLALLSGGIDSPVAAWNIAKRGASTEFIHFHGQPFSDPSSARQATRLAKQLVPWVAGKKLWMVPFGDIQKEIVTSAPPQLRIVLYRRFMMRIAQSIALANGAQALVTGESLGQVASQTLPNMSAIDSVVDKIPVLRPLVGHDKIEIEAIAKKIGTYEISIDPHQDCCVLFVPRQVTTAASTRGLEKAEAQLQVDVLVDKGVAGAEATTIG